MAEKNKETIVDVAETYSKTENYIEENKKSLSIIIGAIALLFGGYFAYDKLYMEPREGEAAELIWKAEYYFEIDSLDKAIAGDGNYFGFDYIASEYGNTRAGNLANYYLGVCYLRKGEYQMALEHYSACNSDDEIIEAMKYGGMGDALVELQQYEQAVSNFESAAELADNDFLSPVFWMKAGLANERLGKYQQAVACYQTVVDEFPNAQETREVTKYLARAEAYIGQ